MRFPDAVTILRPVATDAYGNEGASFTGAEEIPVKGFHVSPDLLLLPRGTDAQDGDRFVIGTDTYAGDVTAIRSPSAEKLRTVRLTRVED